MIMRVRKKGYFVNEQGEWGYIHPPFRAATILALRNISHFTFPILPLTFPFLPKKDI